VRERESERAREGEREGEGGRERERERGESESEVVIRRAFFLFFPCNHIINIKQKSFSGEGKHDIRGVYRFSSLVKQKKKAKNYAVFCFAGKRKLFFYIYDVITWEK
jgi:hypothetical protein